MAQNNIITIEHLSKVFTERKIFEDTEFSMLEGEKVALIGINGTGKSTLLKIVAGLEEPDEGNIAKRRNLAVRYLPQTPEFNPEDTILEAIIHDNEGKQHVFNLETEAKKFLSKLGENDLDQKIKTLSGGQKKRVALASTLLSTADLLILDEPTNHLDGEMSEWLEDYLHNYRGTLLMVTHDRYFLDSVCDRIVELDQGKLYSYKANYAGYLELKAERMDIARAQERTRQNILRNELKWVMRGAKARTTKQKGRLQRYEKLSQMHGPTEEEELKLSSIKTRLGKSTIEIDDVTKSFDGRTLIQNFSYNFLRNDRIGIIGPNGAGKSTLIKMITGWETPDSGEIRIGQTVRIGYFSQENEELDGNQRVIDAMTSIAEYVHTVDGLISASNMLDQFLFPPSQQYMKVEKLSGGEKRRLYLLRVLMSAPNVLILDEPTNDLDIRTMTILENYLDHFDGIVITVSHDRYFLDRVVNRIFSFEGNGSISQYEGGYTDYQVEYLRRHPEAESIFQNAGSISGVGKAVGNDTASSANASDDTSSTVRKSSKDTWHDHSRQALKMTYKEAKEWETIEADIEALEQKIAELDDEILKNSRDFVKLNELTKDKEEAENTLTEKIERWEYLSDLNERILAQKK
ncbi:ABC-F family ATP-binding cassette domain-containing protein [Oribacterium sp. WCC10]|uniref:ABC-F family ATP-binding cassette domain-containing protein n=1 Tax=Oribacterium sp. WCC10 TaxID=1855343 RepID=UPI0008E69BE6|nr:ABC-F family ATP-binding cassette domain-containing protein [Oribacterium sp. WCC10]SFG09988.1 ATP-binding cassette, subfamily F, uup [Oribacterium sp. WCC10]